MTRMFGCGRIGWIRALLFKLECPSQFMRASTDFLITKSRHLLARSLIKARYSTGSLVFCFLVVGFYVCLIILGYYLFILRNLLILQRKECTSRCSAGERMLLETMSCMYICMVVKTKRQL